MTNFESSPATFLAESIMRSPYFNDEPCTYPPFADDDPPTMRTLADLADYAQCHIDNLRPALIDALDSDLRDLAHNSNYDAFLPADITRELCDADYDDITRILNDPDTDLYDQLADALIARAS